MTYVTRHQSPIGPLTLASDGENLIGLWMEGQKYFGGGAAGEFVEKEGLPIFAAARKWLDHYFRGGRPPISELSLAPVGGDFRSAVWNLLCEIPYGECTTYGEIAKKTALSLKRERTSCRAVGGAVGHNPISIVIPCHRVVGANGSLTGYAGGIARKIRLLELEGVDVSRFSVPGGAVRQQFG